MHSDEYTLIGAPNLDDDDPEALLEFIESMHVLRTRMGSGDREALRQILEIVGHVPGRAHAVPRLGVLDALEQYARNKRHAMLLRLAGKVAIAMRFEASCDSLYASLPEGVRW